jgi:hypothetical protein
MPTQADVRRIALAQPETEQASTGFEEDDKERNAGGSAYDRAEKVMRNAVAWRTSR